MRAAPYQSLRVFKSDLLEWFTHIHPATPLIVWGPVAVFFFAKALASPPWGSAMPVSTFLMLTALGLLVWTLAEYVLHRFVFHFSPRSPAQKRFQFIIHALHHDDPNDPTRLVMAPIAALILAVIFYSGFRAMFGAVYVQPFFGAFILGYLAYDYTHYYVHHFTPRTSWGKAVKRHHMAHHFADHDARWGVSSPLWDHVFGTLPRKRPVRPANPAT